MRGVSGFCGIVSERTPLAALVEESAQPLYVRWSKGPEADLSEGACSEDSLTGVELPGLSDTPECRGLVARASGRRVGRPAPVRQRTVDLRRQIDHWTAEAGLGEVDRRAMRRPVGSDGPRPLAFAEARIGATRGMRVERVVYKPMGLVGGVLAGAIAGLLFKQLWRLASGERNAPHATDESRDWPEILAAAALQGAIFALVKAAVDRGGANAVKQLTGRWPG